MEFLEDDILQVFRAASGTRECGFQTTPAEIFLENRQAYAAVFAQISRMTNGRLGERYAREGFYFRPIADVIRAARE